MDAITMGMTVTTTSTVTVTNIVPTQTINAGAIAGGAIGSVVILGAIFAFAWYKIGTHRPTEKPGLTDVYSTRSGGEGAESGVQTTSPSRHPDNIPSGNISKE